MKGEDRRKDEERMEGAINNCHRNQRLNSRPIDTMKKQRCKKERERESVCVYVCVYVCERSRRREIFE